MPRPAGSPGSRGVGGFFGWGLTGALVSQFSRPVGFALAAIGVGRTLYRGVFAKGHEVTFPADTMIQVQLAPGPIESADDRRVSRTFSAALAVLQQTTAPFHVETRLVVVAATVRNARGELVTGLTRDAFTVFENGKRQPIVLFRERRCAGVPRSAD